MSTRPLIELSGIDKQYGGQVALNSVDFQLQPGEIHALLGENGAGKSTLIKILAGVVTRDAGKITIGEHSLPRRHHALEVAAAGLAFVHQDLALIESLSVAENIALTNGYAGRGPFISQRRTRRQVADVLDRLQIDVEPAALVGSLTHDDKVMVAVARAFSSQARAIVLDEVSSSLPGPDTARLAASLRRSRDQGLGYVYVTHRLDEVFGLADRITVLRDGIRVATAQTQQVTMPQLVNWITGSSSAESDTAPTLRTPVGSDNTTKALRVVALRGPGLGAPFSFDAWSGRIVAICGLVGSGATAVAGLLGGTSSPTGGEAWLGDMRLPLGSPARMRAHGCEYVPGDRVTSGVFASLSIRENLFPVRGRTAGEADDGPLIWPRRERRRAQSLIQSFAVRPQFTEAAMGALSGGNQQKVVMARCIRVRPRLLVLEDPTAGVDVGSRTQLHAHIKHAAASGAGVVLMSSDFQEVAALADRALVMSHGRIVADLLGAEITEHRLSEESYGLHDRPEEVLHQ